MRSAHHPEHDPVAYDQLMVVDLTIESEADGGTYRNIVLNQVNDGCVRLAIFETEYGWHSHPNSDEAFLVLDGLLEIDIENGPTLRLTPMKLVTIPAGTVHRTRARGRTVNLTFERLRAATAFK